MESIQTRRIIEGIIFASGESVAIKHILTALPDVSAADIRKIIDALNNEYKNNQRAFFVQEVAGGFQLATDPQLAPWIVRALKTPKPDSVSVAALETLAIVAYRQPITKAEIEAIRGVDVGGALDTLNERRFVRVSGRKDSPGRPFLYSTTHEFLRHFGLKSIDALPSIDLPSIKEPVDDSPEELVSAQPNENATKQL